MQTRALKVCVIGQGYVGLRTAVLCAEADHVTVGFDTDADRVAEIYGQRDVRMDFAKSRLRKLLAHGSLTVTSDEAMLSDFDVAFIAVPTPLKHGQPDQSMVIAASELLAKYLNHDALIIVESTNYPGSTNEVVRPILESNGLVAGKSFALAYSPERVNPGSPLSQGTLTKLVGGINSQSTERAASFLGSVYRDVHVVSSCQAAEFAKLLENTYRLVNVSLANEFAQSAIALGVDIREVLGAASTKEEGFVRFDPGPGAGGHCIPIDPVYLNDKLRQAGEPHSRLVEIALQVNYDRPAWIASKVVHELKLREVAISGANVLAIGASYKANVADSRESCALRVVNELLLRGASVDILDPLIRREDLGNTQAALLTDIKYSSLASYDVVVCLVIHEQVDMKPIVDNSRLILDATSRVYGDGVIPC